MAQTCALCGAEINVFQSQKLVDGNYICRKNCQKKGMKKYFDFMHSDIEDVKAHIAQVEKGTKIFNELFVPRFKASKKERPERVASDLYVSESLGLAAIAPTQYKYFIFVKYYPQAVVFKISDLMGYSEEKPVSKPDGTAVDSSKKYVHLIFKDTAGLSDFFIEAVSPKNVSDYFNKVFRIQKTLGNIGNTWKNQINAAKAVSAGIKAAVNGEDDAEEKAVQAVESLDTAIYGDRTELIRKADEALKPYGGL